MNHRPTVHLAALSAAMLLSANFTPASAKDRTAHDPGATDDPLKAKTGICDIGDGTGVTSGGGTISAQKSGASIDYSDDPGAGLHAKNARNIGTNLLLADTSLHAAGLGTVAAH